MKPPIGTQLDTNHALYSALSHFWPFWEGAGTTVADIKDATKNATIVGTQIVWATDAQGQTVLSSQAVTTNASQLQVPATVFGPAPCTMEFKVKGVALNPNGIFHYSCIFTAGDRNGMNAWNNGFSAPGMGGDSPGVTLYAIHHVFFVVGSDGKVTWYIDGAKHASASTFTQRTLTRMMNDANNERYMAQYEFVRLWSKALSDAEVASLTADPYQMFAPSLTAVTLDPASAIVGTTPQQFTATAQFSNGQSTNVSAAAVWSSSDPAIATVSASGLVTAVSAGTVIITASYQGRTATAEVTTRVADSLLIAPDSLALQSGETGQLAASVHYSDGSSEDHTSDAAWSSSNPAVATVSAAGLVTGVGEGAATITASFAGLSAAAAVTVIERTMLIKLDQKVTIAAGIDYVLMLVMPALKRADGVVQSASGSLVTVATDWSGSDRVRRLVVDGQDLPVASATLADGLAYLKLGPDAAADIALGQTCELWDTDVLETRRVLTGSGDTDTVEVVAFSDLPEAYSTYFLGQLSDVQDFRISAVGRRSDQEMSLQLTKYDPTMYGNLEPTLAPAVDAGGLIAVSDLVALESPNASPESPIVNITWKPGKLTAGVRLYLSRSGLPEYLAADVKGRNYAELAVVAGIEYTVRAVGYDLRGYSAPYASASTTTFTCLGAGLLPQNVAGFYASACVADPASVTLNWTANPTADAVDHYEIRYGGTIANPNWAFSTPLEPNPAAGATSATFASGPGQYLIIAVNAAGYTSSLATVCTAVVGGSTGGTGGGGYGGGGDYCFSGNVEIETPAGWVRFDQLPERFQVRNDFGDFEATLAVHDYAGTMIDFTGAGELITPGHLMRYERGWRPANLYYATAPRVQFQGKVYSARVLSQVPGEQCFRLRTGDVAHNMKAPYYNPN